MKKLSPLMRSVREIERRVEILDSLTDASIEAGSVTEVGEQIVDAFYKAGMTRSSISILLNISINSIRLSK